MSDQCAQLYYNGHLVSFPFRNHEDDARCSYGKSIITKHRMTGCTGDFLCGHINNERSVLKYCMCLFNVVLLFVSGNAATVGLALTASLVALWTPFYVFSLTIPFCHSLCVNPAIWSLCEWLGFATSGVAPALLVLDTRVRDNFRSMVSCRKSSNYYREKCTTEWRAREDSSNDLKPCLQKKWDVTRVHSLPRGLFYEHSLPDNKTWISNYVVFLWDVITHPCHDFHGGLAKPSFKFGCDRVITFHCLMWLLIHVSP